MGAPKQPLYPKHQGAKAVLRNRSRSKGPMTDSIVTQVHNAWPLAFSDHPGHSRQLLGQPDDAGTEHLQWR